MEKKIYIAPEITVEVLEEEDIVLISLGDSGDLPTIPWNGAKRDESEW